MRDLDTRWLEIFCCVYEKGSISKSSDCLHLSQSTISFHINQLERSIGLKLFYKKGRALIPTSNAHMLYPYAKKILEVKLLALEEIKLITGSYRGHIRVGASSIPGTYILPPLIASYLVKNPNSSIELIVEDSMKVVRMVEDGCIDVGVVGFRCSNPDFETVEIWKDVVHFIGSRNIDRNLSIEDLTKYPFILREDSSGTRQFVENVLKKYGVDFKDLNVVAIVNSNDAILSLLKEMDGVSFMSYYALKSRRDVKILSLRDVEPISRSFYLLYDRHRPQSPATKLFLDMVLSQRVVQV